MYAYCNDNPVKYKDSDGNCTTNARGDNIHYNCGYIAIDPRARYSVLASMSLSKQLLDKSETWIINTTRYLYRNAPRPSNIGKGTYKKYVESKIKHLDDFDVIFKELMDVADFIYINGEIVYGIYDNCQNQASDMKIVWDAMVDATVLGLSAYATSYIAAIFLAAATNPVGIGIALAAAAGIEILFDKTADGVRTGVKGWVD